MTGTTAGERSLARAPLALSPWHRPHLFVPAHEIAVAQPEGLADSHPGLRQHRQEEPIPGVFGGCEHCNKFFGVQRAWCQPRHHQLDRSCRHRPPFGDVVQERFVGATADPTPRHQFGGDLDTRTGMVLVESEHSRRGAD